VQCMIARNFTLMMAGKMLCTLWLYIHACCVWCVRVCAHGNSDLARFSGARGL
jgi:hypothetical protein